MSQVYRALEEIGDLVVNDNGLVRGYSEKIKQEITGIVQRIENFVADGVDAVARLANVETRSTADSAIQRWMSKYGAEFEEATSEGGRGTLRFETVLANAGFVDVVERDGLHDEYEITSSGEMYLDGDVDAELRRPLPAMRPPHKMRPGWWAGFG